MQPLTSSHQTWVPRVFKTKLWNYYFIFFHKNVQDKTKTFTDLLIVSNLTQRSLTLCRFTIGLAGLPMAGNNPPAETEQFREGEMGQDSNGKKIPWEGGATCSVVGLQIGILAVNCKYMFPNIMFWIYYIYHVYYTSAL